MNEMDSTISRTSPIIAEHTLRGKEPNVLFTGLLAYFLFIYLRPQDILPILGMLRFVFLYLCVLMTLFLLSRNGKPILHMDYFSRLLLLFTASVFASIPLSYWPGGSFENTLDFLKVLLVLILCHSIIDSFDRLRQITRIMVLSSGLLSLLVLPAWLSGASHGEIRGPVGGMFENPNDLATNLVLVLPMAYYFIIEATESRKKLLNIAIFTIILLGIFATQSRGGMLGAGIALILITLADKNKVRSFLLLGLLLFPILILSPQGGLERLSTISEEAQEDTSRVTLWISGFRMMLANPFGVGIGQFGSAYGQDFRYELDEENRWPDAHGTYNQIISELGILGVAAYVMLLYTTFKNMRFLKTLLNRRGKNVHYADFVTFLRIAFISYLFCILFISFAYTIFNFLVMCFISILMRIKDDLIEGVMVPV